MTLEEAQKTAARLLRDDYGRPCAHFAYVYCTGRFAVVLRTDDGDYVLLDDAAVNVYRANHPPQERWVRRGEPQAQG